MWSLMMLFSRRRLAVFVPYLIAMEERESEGESVWHWTKWRRAQVNAAGDGGGVSTADKFHRSRKRERRIASTIVRRRDPLVRSASKSETESSSTSKILRSKKSSKAGGSHSSMLHCIFTICLVCYKMVPHCSG